MTDNIFERIARHASDEYTGQDPIEGKLTGILLKAIETTREMVIVTDAPDQIGEEKIVFVNTAFVNETQYPKEEVLGRSPSFLQGPDTDRKVIDKLVEKLENGEPFEGETFNYTKDGSRYRLHWTIDPIRDDEGNITHFVSVQRNITDEWEQQQKLEKMVEERETLVKETHHRIKNNLATISGLLELQAMETDSEEIRSVLSESMNRVQSIASIHEKLYETEGLSSISLESYIRDLVEYFESSMERMGDPADVTFELNLEAITLDTTQAVPLGLILNELITNAQKHAFDEKGGTIAVSCREKNGSIHLEVSDNGRGLPEDLDIEKTGSLGLKLIETLSGQLNATYTLESDKGTRFRMRFNKHTNS